MTKQMKLLPSPRFHIMSNEEIAISSRKINVDKDISNIKSQIRELQWELSSREDLRDMLHDIGFYVPYSSLRIAALEFNHGIKQ